MNRRNCTERGVTWMEVMVGVGIGAIVVAAFIPNMIQKREQAQKTSCIANLRSIDGAKQQWALDKKKTKTAVPLEADLFGPGIYIQLKPECPSGGSYTLNAVSAKPTCSVPGHAL